jgi:hypothetical protein
MLGVVGGDLVSSRYFYMRTVIALARWGGMGMGMGGGGPGGGVGWVGGDVA